MTNFKKFYDAALPDAGGGNTEVLEQSAAAETKEAPVASIAELMAKQGVRATNDNQAAKPIVNTEKKEEPKQTEKEKVETTTTSSSEKEKPESLPPQKEAEEAESKPIAQAAAPTLPKWQEVLKSQQPNDVLKELGINDKQVRLLNELKDFEKIDFFSNLVSEWKKSGDLKGYLKELSTDYEKMPPEEVMRHQLRVEYPKATERQLDILFKNEIVKAYHLDSEDDDEVQEGKMLLEAKAEKFRDTLIANQKEKLFPNVPEAKPIEPDLTEQKAQQEIEAYKSTVNSDPYFQKIMDKKQFIVGKGEDKFVFPVDPEVIRNVLFDSDKWSETQFEKVKNDDGSFNYVPKVQNQVLTSLVAVYGQAFLDAYAQHYLSVGSKKAIEPLQNAKIPDNNTVPNTVASPSNPAAAMAKGGVRVSSGS